MFDVRTLFAAFRRPEPSTAYGRGIAALERGSHAAALAAFAQALGDARTPGDSANAHNKSGVALVAMRRRDEALDAFVAALIADERCAPALVNLGNLLLEDAHVCDAVDYYEAAIRLDDRYAPAHRNLGVALRNLGRRLEAVRALKTAARLEGRRSERS